MVVLDQYQEHFQSLEKIMAKAKPEGEAQEVNTVTLAEICAEMGIKTTSARVKLRKKLTGREGNARWVFPLEQKDEIIALLTPAPKAEAGEGEGEGEGE